MKKGGITVEPLIAFLMFVETVETVKTVQRVVY